MSASAPVPASGGLQQFFEGLAIQRRVIGALLLRELHTRYGRENIGYLWMIGEPLILASVISLIHKVTNGSGHFSSDIQVVPATIIGYTVFIVFRGIFNRAEGALEANQPLMYHKMVTIFDIMLSKAMIEVVGCFATMSILLSLAVGLNLADWPVRPLYLLAGVCYMFWLSFAASLVVVGITYDNHLVGRLVHPFSYFMIPLSGSFWFMEWLPVWVRNIMEWNPFVTIFEMARYGQFRSANPNYFFPAYLALFCGCLTYCGMTLIRKARRHIHLN